MTIEERSPAGYSYATHLNVLFPQLEKIDVPKLVHAVTDKWYNQTRAPQRCVILMVENAGIVPTGDEPSGRNVNVS